MAVNCDQNLLMWMEALKFVGKFQRLFITGCPKSGTTWMLRAINGHPQIVADGEGRFAWRLQIYLQGAIDGFNEDQRQFGASPHGQITRGEMTLVMRALSDFIMLRYLHGSGKPGLQVKVIADKTPQHVLEVANLRVLYPTCRFINIVRDPRDAAASALFHLAKNDARSKDQYVESFITETWRLHVEAAVRAEKDLGTDSFLNVRYEDFHVDEAAVLRKCFALAGVYASDETIELCRKAGSFEAATGGRKRGQSDPNSFFRNGMMGDWMNHIDPSLAEFCCRKVGDLMDKFGYPVRPPIETKVYVPATPVAPETKAA